MVKGKLTVVVWFVDVLLVDIGVMVRGMIIIPSLDSIQLTKHIIDIFSK